MQNFRYSRWPRQSSIEFANVYVPELSVHRTRLMSPNGKGRRYLARRSLSEHRPGTSLNDHMYNSFSPTLRRFASNSVQSAPEQASLGVQGGHPDAAHHLLQAQQHIPEDLSPDSDMIPLQPDLGLDGYPPLPSIVNEATLRRVFTHRSFFARPSNVFEDSATDPSPDNEVLEHIGDSVLSLTTTNLIHDLHPHLRVGPATKIRAMVVGNSTLAGISVNYQLPTRLRLHHAQAASLRASIKVQADVFEAYVGGVFTDRGLVVTQDWIYALFRPYVREAYRIVRTQHGLPPAPDFAAPSPARPMWAQTPGMDAPIQSSPSVSTNTSDEEPSRSPPARNGHQATGHLALLNQRLQQSRKAVEWKYSKEPGPGTRTTPRWKATCSLDNAIIAQGTGTSKKAAQNAAAREGLASMGISVD